MRGGGGKGKKWREVGLVIREEYKKNPIKNIFIEHSAKDLGLMSLVINH